MSEITKLQPDCLLPAPNSGGNVWPHQSCPSFTPRSCTMEALPECWYCQYADFHLNRHRALEVGICEWPKKILK